MSENRQQRRKRQKYFRIAALLLCLAVLAFSVWLLFIPNQLNHRKGNPMLHNNAGTAGTESAAGTEQNADAQGFLAVLEGSTAQLPAADGSWNSSDTSVAEVDSSGTVTGVQQGRCQITDGKTITRSPCGIWNSGRREPMQTAF